MMELSLFDLELDPGERVNIAAGQKDVVASLMKFVERAREDLGDSLTNRVGQNIRPPAVLPPDAPSIPEGATPR
jgi:arylsulfatase